MDSKKLLPEGKLDPELLEILLADLPTDESIMIKPGLGFDSAAIKLDTDYISVATDPITFATQNIGTYSLAVNINDIVCQGCIPRWYTASFMLPPKTRWGELKNYWQDLVTALDKWKVSAAGGHTEVTDAVNRPLLCGQLIGEPKNNKFLDPQNIKPGHFIYQWRPAALEGLALVAGEYEKKLEKYVSIENIKSMQKLLEDPGICVWPEAKKLLDIKQLTALHDPTEGGIATALHELADACGRGLQIKEDNLLWPKKGMKLARALKIDPLGLLSSGCLLVVTGKKLVSPDKYSLVKIGKFNKNNEKIIVSSSGKTKPLPRYNQDQLLKAFKKLKTNP